MLRKRVGVLGLLLTLLALGSPKAVGQKVIAIDGSSTVYPMTEAVAEEYQKEKEGQVRVTVGISGTGGGFKKFLRGETDIQDASRPISSEEMEQARKNKIEYIEIPIIFDALTIAVNPENTWVDYLTVEELKRIWEPAAQDTITHWNQIRPEWPHEKIVLFGPGADSGTFDYFTEAIVGKAKSSRGDFTGSEDDNVLVQGIEGSKFALGYIPFAYYAPHKDRLKAVPIQWSKNSATKKPVLPSLQNVMKGIYNPLSRPLFIYVNKHSADTKPEVREFVEFYLENAEVLAKQVKYLPLPESAYEMGLERFQNRQVGTGFDGHSEVGLTVEEILQRTPRL